MPTNPIFKKHNPHNNDSLLKEASGLNALREQVKALNLSYIKVPDVYSVTRNELQIEKIISSQPSAANMARFGRELAVFHSEQSVQYGWHENNFIGLSEQPNQLADDWGMFFIECRLRPQIALVKKSDLRDSFHEQVEKHEKTLVDFLSTHCFFPSLLHGDMWSGNVLFDQQNAWLIDPAVYYGDSEADIAMTEMFGGFTQDFYSGYGQVKKLSPAYPKKKHIYNLYHYLNHLNLFGSAYLAGCEQGFQAIASL